MEKINIAELLQKCPKGMELYSPICGDCRLIKIYTGLGFDVINDTDEVFNFSYDGRYHLNGECCIFPSKENRDWSKFQRPFKDGDVLYTVTGEGEYRLCMVDCIIGDTLYTKVSCSCNGHFLCTCEAQFNIEELVVMRLATEEEKQKLFDVIKANGYKWNAETKTLEKLIEPKFKVGDKIKIVHKEDYRYIITQVTDTHYTIRETDEGFLYTEPITEDENWELVSNKFDITTLKPFDKVLVRDSDKDMWCASIFSHTWKDKYFCVGAWHNQCISYEANKELLGTTHNPEEYGSR